MKCTYCSRSADEAPLTKRETGVQCKDLDSCATYRRQSYAAGLRAPVVKPSERRSSVVFASDEQKAQWVSAHKNHLHDDSGRGVLPQVTAETPARQSMSEFLFGGVRVRPGRAASAFDAFLSGRPVLPTSVRLDADDPTPKDMTPTQQRAWERLLAAQRSEEHEDIVAACLAFAEAMRN